MNASLALQNESRSACRRGEDFSMDVGSFTVIGPSPISQRITCIAGQTCRFQVSGTGIELDEAGHHSYMILDTCGINSVIEGLPYNWAIEVVTAAGGTYQLCWCGSSNCTVAAEFLLPFGQVQVLGPSLSQDRTCVAGRTCRLDLEVFGESTFESTFGDIFVLQTCGVSTFTNGFPGFVDTPSNVSGWPRWPWSTTSLQLGLITAPAGDYRLCWCASCSNNSIHLTNTSIEHRLDIGGLRIQGVLPLQDRTCISGQTCSIDGILGMDLQDKDAVMALDTCGTTLAIPRWAWSGSAISALNGTAFSWGNEPVTATGGQYRLCWCPASGMCRVPGDFVIDFGSLLLLGPDDLEHIGVSRTCISGQRCSLAQIDSQGLPPSEVVILDTCGVESQIWHFPAISRLANESILGWMVTASGGQYRICWCASSVCDDAEQFRVDAGSLVLLGPAPLQQHRTCVAGQSCRIEGISGIGLRDRQGGLFAVLDTCGTIGTVANLIDTLSGTWHPSFPTLFEPQHNET